MSFYWLIRILYYPQKVSGHYLGSETLLLDSINNFDLSFDCWKEEKGKKILQRYYTGLPPSPDYQLQFKIFIESLSGQEIKNADLTTCISLDKVIVGGKDITPEDKHRSIHLRYIPQLLKGICFCELRKDFDSGNVVFTDKEKKMIRNLFSRSTVSVRFKLNDTWRFDLECAGKYTLYFDGAKRPGHLFFLPKDYEDLSQRQIIK